MVTSSGTFAIVLLTVATCLPAAARGDHLQDLQDQLAAAEQEQAEIEADLLVIGQTIRRLHRHITNLADDLGAALDAESGPSTDPHPSPGEIKKLLQRAYDSMSELEFEQTVLMVELEHIENLITDLERRIQLVDDGFLLCAYGGPFESREASGGPACVSLEYCIAFEESQITILMSSCQNPCDIIGVIGYHFGLCGD